MLTPRRGKLTAIVILMIIVAALPATVYAEAAQRHPLGEQTPLRLPGSLVLDERGYRCLLLEASRAIIASVVFSPLSDASRQLALSILMVADMFAEMAGGDDPETLRAEYSRYLLNLLAATFQGHPLTTREVSLVCDGTEINGPLGPVALTLALAVKTEEGYVLLPFNDNVEVNALQETAGPGSEDAAVAAGAGPVERRVRLDEFLPPEEPLEEGAISDVLRGVVTGGDAQQAEVPQASGLTKPSSAPLVDVRAQLQRILDTFFGGGEGIAAGGSQVGSNSSQSPIAANGIAGDAIANIVLDYQLIAALAQALGEEAGGFEGEFVEVGVYKPPAPRREVNVGYTFPLFAALAATLLTLLYTRRDIVARAARSIGLVRGAPQHPIAECYFEALSVLERRGLGKHEWETPREHLTRISSMLEKDEHEAMKAIVSFYEMYAYSPLKPGDEEAVACYSNLGVLRK